MGEKRFVNYLDFGAVGDGITDDFAAILQAHEYANENQLPVVIDDGRSYLIRNTFIDGEVRSVVIKTDVLWGSAKIVIDDTDIDYFDGTTSSVTPVFKIVSDFSPIEITDKAKLSSIGKVGEGTERLELSLGYPALVVIYDENERVYKRYGSTYINQSSPKHEILLVDGDGNVSPQTPFMFDYDRITKITVIRADVSPITVSGGEIITRTCQKNPYKEKTGERAKYVHRNILINRSNVTLDGVKHYVLGEVSLRDYAESGLAGAHYWGFFCVSYASNIHLVNCVLTGRRSYRFSSYEFHADHVNKIILEGCTQSNFTITDEHGETVFSMSPSPLTKWPRCWGIGGSNFCKNMEYLNCRLSRFDAHQGLYNGKIINSTINFMEIIGKGELVLENVEWNSPSQGRIYNSFAYLRDDFGCTWDGVISFKDCTFNVSEGDARVFFYNYADWDFGYRRYFPNLLIDNPTVNGLMADAKIYIASDDVKKVKSEDKISSPSYVRVVNNTKGYKFFIQKCHLFENCEKLGVIEDEGDT